MGNKKKTSQRDNYVDGYLKVGIIKKMKKSLKICNLVSITQRLILLEKGL